MITFVFFPFLLRYVQSYGDTSVFIVNRGVNSLYDLFSITVIAVDNFKFRYHPRYGWLIAKYLLRFKFEKAINLSPHRWQRAGEDILEILRADNKYCYVGDTLAPAARRKCTHRIGQVNFTGGKKYGHIFQHELEIFSAITKCEIQSDVKNIFRDAFFELKARLADGDQVPYRNYVAIVPDAGNKYRSFTKEWLQTIIAGIPPAKTIILIGFSAPQVANPNLVNMINKTSLLKAMNVVLNASLVIGAETGLTHLAYLAGIPTVCIMGGGHFGRFLPWPEFEDTATCVYEEMHCFRCSWDCQFVDLLVDRPPCLANISIDAIQLAVKEKVKFLDV